MFWEFFRDAAINLSHIDKRPSGRRNWEYTFFIDADAHQRDPAMQQAIELARSHCVALKVLGSYPRATPDPLAIAPGGT